MRAIQTHREYYEEMAATLPWHSHRPVAYILAPWAALGLWLFVVHGMTAGAFLAISLLHLISKAWTFEWFSFQVWKLYGQYDA